jgi:hypothetical protein
MGVKWKFEESLLINSRNKTVAQKIRTTLPGEKALINIDRACSFIFLFHLNPPLKATKCREPAKGSIVHVSSGQSITVAIKKDEGVAPI